MIVVTGLGAVSAFGEGVEPLWRGLLAGSTGFRTIDRFDASRHRTRLGAQADDPGDDRSGSARGETSLADRFALAAAREAVLDARLLADAAEDLEASGRRVGVLFGSSTGGMLESERFFAALAQAPGSVGKRARLRDLVSQPPSGPAEAVARRYGASGLVQTVSSACASAALAIARAADALMDGEIDVALAGGSDSLCELTYAGFNSLRSVDAGPCRPFRLGREGLSLGEGAAVLVLERLDDARRRGASILAVVAGAGASCDAHHMTAPDPTGLGVARATRAALAEAGVDIDQVAFWNAHGTGTPLNDAAEWAALREVFGARAGGVPVTSPKGSIGHFLGSAGAIEAVVTVLSLARGQLPPTPGDGPVDPAAAVDLVLGAPRPLHTPEAGVSVNFAFGGSNAALVFCRAPQTPQAAPS